MSGSNPDFGEVEIDGYRFKLAGPFQPSAVDRFPPKLTFGDYQIDSNDLLSAWTLKDLTGGSGVARVKPGVTDNRYRFSTLYTRYPGQLTKPFSMYKSVIGTGSVFPLGEMYDYAAGEYDYYAASGLDLFRDQVDTTYNLGGTPASKGVAFRGAGTTTFFYIPLGNNGYAIYEPATPTFANINTGSADDNFQAFCVWHDKLIGIANNGQISRATTAANPTTFTSYGDGGRLDRAIEPKSLQVFRNAAGDPTPFVITDSGVYAFDVETPRLYEIPDFFSRHPRFGYAAAVWRGNLYVTAGMDILEYNGSVVRNIGLSRDDSLPWYYSGFVRDLVAGQNALYALVYGQTQSGTTYYSLHEFSGIGWHCIYVSTGVPIRAVVTRAGTNYRLYWGLSADGKHYYQTLPVSFTNPEEELNGGLTTMMFGDFTNPVVDANGNNNYTGTYYFESGRFDAAMPGYRKIANAVEINVSHLDETNETLRVKYRVDNATAWTQLGADITVEGEYVLPFGTLTDGVYRGLPWKTIEFRIEVVDDITTPYVQSRFAMVEYLVFSFLKVNNPSWAWTCAIDLSAEHGGQSPENQLAKLIALKDSSNFYAMKHRESTYRVRISQISGVEETGYDTRGRVTLSIIEIPQKLGAPT